jgi:hypothetical protein
VHGLHAASQGDQKIGGKIAQFQDKIAKTVSKPNKNAKTSSPKLDLKVKIYIKHF